MESEESDAHTATDEIDMVLDMLKDMTRGAKRLRKALDTGTLSRKERYTLVQGLEECRDLMSIPVGCLKGRAIYGKWEGP